MNEISTLTSAFAVKMDVSRVKTGRYGRSFQVGKNLTTSGVRTHNMSNNTPQAYPAIRRGDAQTGGLLFPGREK